MALFGTPPTPPPLGVVCCRTCDLLVADEVGVSVGVVWANGEAVEGVGGGGLEGGGGVLGLGGRCN